MAIDISKLSPIESISKSLASAGSAQATGPSTNTFSTMFDSALKMLDQTNQTVKAADQMSTDFALGKIDNVHEVMIAQQKANVALQFTVQLRNSFLDAYNEIMRIQM